MRELKFRAWDSFVKKFKYGSRVVAHYTNCEPSTGLKDIYGKEIYVGDIISFSIPHFDKSTFGYDGETELVGKIIFDYDRYCIEDKDGINYDLYPAEGREVIGNIHENGELLGR